MDLYTCIYPTDIHKKIESGFGDLLPLAPHQGPQSSSFIEGNSGPMDPREEIAHCRLKPVKPVQEAQTSPLPLGIHILAYYFGRSFQLYQRPVRIQESQVRQLPPPANISKNQPIATDCTVTFFWAPYQGLQPQQS